MKINSIISSFFAFTNSQFVNILDWSLAIIAIIYGVFRLALPAEDQGIIWPLFCLLFGILGLYLAYKKPSKAIQKAFKQK